MRYAILGDIHANLEALLAVVDRIRDESVSRVLCVGDVVGYGAAPADCIDVLRSLDASVVLGNHDAAVAERLDPSDFNLPARRAVEWTKCALEPTDKRWLGELPLLAEEDDFALAHGTYSAPERFDYVTRPRDAQASLESMRTRVCFIGHTHVPVTMVRTAEGSRRTRVQSSDTIDLRGSHRALVNVGSVGQPRDGDPRAAFALYDPAEEQVRILRVAYDVERAASRIRSAGLPSVLAERLFSGL